MLIPNNTVMVYPRLGRDAYGQIQVGSARLAHCTVVYLRIANQKTSVRADSSASRGAARERVVQARLLFPEAHAPEEGDKLVIRGIEIKVTGFQPRFDAVGRLSHIEVDGESWGES